ncbi:VacJ family lipoprotein [Halomonas saccharevitans]|uniref:VacJ family lipoprotein n=2 Tax=Halomonas saccharevitans TaxID=416872 RepID=A0ABU3NBJ7_9GAMM|nr:VacJ family lipoprotein [Halomonas saccharevitans]MDT8878566.1 VacJ family lipoprotein [Halomonas saccharevitans]
MSGVMTGAMTQWAGRGALVMSLALLAGCASSGEMRDRHPDDPWEGFNRKVFAFNDVVDRYALKPAAQGYRFITPDPVETSVGNFFSNLGEIRTTLNSLLQGKGANAGVATGRFLINTTVGIGGLFDVATRMEITGREEDFGQTLGAWGWEESRYLVLPLLGPSTLRDTGGLPVDMATYPTTYVEEDKVRLSLTALRVIDTRAGLLDQEALISGDRYSFIRDAYLQQRRFEVNDGQLGEDPFASDEFDFDDADFDDAFAE